MLLHFLADEMPKARPSTLPGEGNTPAEGNFNFRKGVRVGNWTEELNARDADKVRSAGEILPFGERAPRVSAPLTSSSLVRTARTD